MLGLLVLGAAVWERAAVEGDVSGGVGSVEKVGARHRSCVARYQPLHPECRTMLVADTTANPRGSNRQSYICNRGGCDGCFPAEKSRAQTL
jgi:hypothetical protein